MSRSPERYPWRAQMAHPFPNLRQPRVMGWALWSLGMIVVRSCSWTAIADGWSCQLGQPFPSVRERWRDTDREAEAKAGAPRAELDRSPCWALWLNWVWAGGSGTPRAIALDATRLGPRWVGWVIRVIDRGGAVPIRWKVLPAEVKPPGKPEGRAWLKAWHGRVPPSGTVIVLADRGWYAKGWCEGLPQLGGHPMLRVNAGGTFRPAGGYHRRPFTDGVPTVGSRWPGRGTAFSGKKTRLDGTLLADGGEGHPGPGLILTDGPPHAAEACGYGLSAWIEPGFKPIKSGGWQWPSTRRTDPTRAERLGWAIAIATGGWLSVGGEAEAAIPTTTFPSVPGSPRPQGRRGR